MYYLSLAFIIIFIPVSTHQLWDYLDLLKVSLIITTTIALNLIIITTAILTIAFMLLFMGGLISIILIYSG